jgi:hypothetical protein
VSASVTATTPGRVEGADFVRTMTPFAAGTARRSRVPCWIARVAVALAVAMAAALTSAQVYKCTDADGKTTYSDTQCARGGKALAIPNDPAPAATSGTVCAQMKDELARLAAGERAGTAPSPRRVSLSKQYAARCVGISRTPPEKQ